MLARQIRRLRPGLVLLQHPDDLIFREPRSLHLSVLQEARTLNPRGGKSQRQVTDPKADLNRADDLLSKALALEPTNASAHNTKAWVLNEKGRFEEAIAERERTLALDPADVGAMAGMAWDHVALGQYE